MFVDRLMAIHGGKQIHQILKKTKLSLEGASA
jgi:hypothetical protein